MWGEHYTVEKVQPDALPAGSVVDTWRMRRLPKGAKIEEKGGKEYNELVIKCARARVVLFIRMAMVSSRISLSRARVAGMR